MNNSNTFFIRFGLNPDDYESTNFEPIQTDKGFIYEVYQKVDRPICPNCGSVHCVKHSHYTTTIKAKQNSYIDDVLLIHKSRYKCCDYNKTFVPDLNGISKKYHMTDQVVHIMQAEFSKSLTFKTIADMHGISTSRCLQIFDRSFPYVARGKMPRVLCIDEISFKIEDFTKYICILYDFETRKIIDVIRSRKMEVLREYFGNIPLNERKNVKFFISDMYDAYSSVCHTYFPEAIHIVDLFHVMKLLTAPLNTYRAKIMNTCCKKKTPEYTFMKKFWRMFLKNANDIKMEYFHYSKTNINYPINEIITRCLRLDPTLSEAYLILQELYRYNDYFTFTEADNFVLWLKGRLELTGKPIFQSVAKSFKKWHVEIANGFNKRDRNFRYTNAIAENQNNHIKTLVKIAYGYQNFERFRKRILLISRG